MSIVIKRRYAGDKWEPIFAYDGEVLVGPEEQMERNRDIFELDVEDVFERYSGNMYYAPFDQGIEQFEGYELFALDSPDGEPIEVKPDEIALSDGGGSAMGSGTAGVGGPRYSPDDDEDDNEDDEMGKEWRYVEDPTEAPEWANIEEGPRGGLRYWTGDEPTDESGTDGDDELSIEDLESGDEVVADLAFGGETEVTFIQHLPGNSALVETEDGDELTVDASELGFAEEEEQTGDLLDDILGEFEGLGEPEDNDEGEERERLSPEEERELRADIAQQNIEQYDIDPHEHPSGEPIGASIDTDAIEEHERSRLDDDARRALSQLIEEPEVWDVPMTITSVGDDVDYGPWRAETDIAMYDGEPDWNAGYVDVEMDIDSFLTLQEQMLLHFADSEEDNYNSFYAGLEDKVEDYAETFAEEPGEIPMPFMEFDTDGNLIPHQEGRHRAVASSMAGEETMPVRMVVRADREGRTDEEHADILKREATKAKSGHDTSIPHNGENRRLKGSYIDYVEMRRVIELNKSRSEQSTFGHIDAELMKFYTHVVWYDVEKDPDDVDLGKAPEMWRSSDEVPEFVKEYIEQAIAAGAFWDGNLKHLPAGVEQQVRDLFEEKMTQPQGWSLGSIVDDLEEMFPGADKSYLLDLTRNEVSAIANKAREEAYLETTPADEDFYWSGPQDFRTTDICEAAKELTNPRFGGEPMELEELREALETIAEASDDGNLIRASEWMFHHQCRHTFVRAVYL